MSESSKGALSLIWSKQWTQEQGRHRSPTRKEGNSFHFSNCPLHTHTVLQGKIKSGASSEPDFIQNYFL